MKKEDNGSDDLGRWLDRVGLSVEGETIDSPTAMTRRSALKLMGASFALAMGLGGCQRKPQRKIVSMHSGPEYQKPGQALYYASTWTDGPFPYGMMIKTVDGRPIKIEGNPTHPVNGTASCAAMQASILSLYDPNRLHNPLDRGKKISWPMVDDKIVTALKEANSAVLLTRSKLGPSERALVKRFLKIVPRAQHFVYESVHDGVRRSVWQEVFGREGELLTKLDRARVILSIESDFLATDGAVLESVRQFAGTRDPAGKMSRLYVAESGLSLTGANADHRLRLRPSAALGLVQALRDAIKGDAKTLSAFAESNHISEKLLTTLADDLKSHRTQAVVLTGSHLPRAVHAAVCLLNDELDAMGNTVAWNPSPAAMPISPRRDIESALAKGVDVLICMGVNPVYDWPTGNFAHLIEKAKLSIGHGLYADETVSKCTLSLPSSHNLEQWNDASPRPGLHSLCQPVIAPLYESRQEAQSLFVWTKKLAADDGELQACKDWHDYLRLAWLKRLFPNAVDAERRWEDSLRSGVIIRSVKPRPPKLQRPAATTLAESTTDTSVGPLELLILPHPSVYDGRFAEIGWLQELPDPISKLVWDNAAAISSATAEKLGVCEGDIIQIKTEAAGIELPVLIQVAMADDVIVTTMGHGRTKGGQTGIDVGVNVAPMMRSDTTPQMLSSVHAVKTGKRYELVRTQKHSSMHGRALVIEGTLAEYTADPHFVKHKKLHAKKADIYKPYDYSKGHKWGLAIDMSKCTGCGGCIIACQAENNIPIVGKVECGRGREMHWLRIDRYYQGRDDDLDVLMQPMTCQHCDNAPCENVCPVNATAHSSEGLNQMIYNRCIGTRYCSNNCPYKVRRFNFFDYQKRQLKDAVQELAFNPQVTVRSVGIMEKCTFCIQRINAAKFKAKNADKPIADGAIKTACEQACPAGAIAFGDLNDSNSRAAQWRGSQRTYFVLEELNVGPNVAYLANVRNPHPDVAASDHGADV